MAILQGEYNLDDVVRRTYPDPDATRRELNPERVRVTATPDEFTRIGELPDRKHISGHQDSSNGTETISIPPDRDLVQHIARKVEVQVPDENLVDWMRRGG